MRRFISEENKIIRLNDEVNSGDYVFHVDSSIKTTDSFNGCYVSSVGFMVQNAGDSQDIQGASILGGIARKCPVEESHYNELHGTIAALEEMIPRMKRTSHDTMHITIKMDNIQMLNGLKNSYEYLANGTVPNFFEFGTGIDEKSYERAKVFMQSVYQSVNFEFEWSKAHDPSNPHMITVDMIAKMIRRRSVRYKKSLEPIHLYGAFVDLDKTLPTANPHDVSGHEAFDFQHIEEALGSDEIFVIFERAGCFVDRTIIHPTEKFVDRIEVLNNHHFTEELREIKTLVQGSTTKAFIGGSGVLGSIRKAYMKPTSSKGVFSELFDGSENIIGVGYTR